VLLRDHWTDVLRVVVAATVAAVSTIFGVFALSFAVDTAGLDRSAMLWVAILANVVALAAIPLWATLADRPKARVHHGRSGQCRAHGRLPVVDHHWFVPTGVPRRRAALRNRLQRGQRGLARLLR
jgi:hypothetical protein